MGPRIGFYYKQFFFFIGLVIVCITAYVLVYRHFTSASLGEEIVLDRTKNSYQLDLEVFSNGNVKIGEHVYKNLIVPLTDHDQLKYVVFSEEGVYLNQIQVSVHLPAPLEKTQFYPRVYAVHGVGSHQEELVNKQLAIFTAYDLTPIATYTIELNLPKGIIDYSWQKEILFGLRDLPFTFWVFLSLIPLVVTMLILFYAYHKTAISWTIHKTKGAAEIPPEDLSPAEAAVLLEDKISPRAIAATFIDLARRGKINIVDHETYFTFSKTTTFSQNLKKFEAILLSKIFTPSQRTVYKEDIEFRIGHHIFSRKIALVYSETYNSLFAKGYFIKNPLCWQSGYRRAGYIIFFIGLIGFIANIVFLPALIYALLIWFTIMVGAGFLVKIAPRLPARSPEGMTKTGEWIKFKNYLNLGRPFGYSYAAQGSYEKYLPYAVAFGVEEAWTRRFVDYPFAIPRWLVSDRKVILWEDLPKEIIPFVYYISSKLAQAREPIT